MDEISFVRDWNVLVLGLFNSGFLENKRIYLTGSSSISLLKETFPGREFMRTVFLPLQFREYFDLFYGKIPADEDKVNLQDIRLTYEKSLQLMPYIIDLNSALSAYVTTGGLLSPSFSFRTTRIDPLDSLFETYRDASISDIAKLDRSQKFFREILNALITSYSSRISANSIARNTSIGSHKTVESYIELMEQLFLIRTFYMRRDGKISLRSNRKIYFLDPFIYRVLKLYSTGNSEYGENELSKIIEGIVGIHLSNLGNEVCYEHTKSGKEVDFVINGICIEVKWGNRDTRELFCDKGYLLTRNAIPKLTGEKASMPVSIFLYMNSAVNPLH
ncbi:MAG: ATP-binding protein [Thermoplasmataceae archaeon]